MTMQSSGTFNLFKPSVPKRTVRSQSRAHFKADRYLTESLKITPRVPVSLWQDDNCGVNSFQPDFRLKDASWVDSRSAESAALTVRLFTPKIITCRKCSNCFATRAPGCKKRSHCLPVFNEHGFITQFRRFFCYLLSYLQPPLVVFSERLRNSGRLICQNAQREKGKVSTASTSESFPACESKKMFHSIQVSKLTLRSGMYGGLLAGGAPSGESRLDTPVEQTFIKFWTMLSEECTPLQRALPLDDELSSIVEILRSFKTETEGSNRLNGSGMNVSEWMSEW